VRAGPRAVSFVLGAGADALLGDPPNTWHPVHMAGVVARVYEGIAWARLGAPVAGALGAAGLPAMAGLLATVVERAASTFPGGGVAAGAAMLAAASAQRTLMLRAVEVADALEAGDLVEARRLLGYHLVSRPTADLDAGEAAAAAVESVAENLGDGVAGPWLAFAVAGAGGAWAYRTVNTLDSMWGYRTERYAEFGRAAARLDDLANLLPARAAALATCIAAERRLGRGREAYGVWRRDGRRTESPNAGQPMAAMAGALGVTLAKRGHYVLGAGGREATAADVRRAVAVAREASVVLAVMSLGVIGLRGVWWG